MIDTLYKYGFRSARDVMMADIEALCEVPGIGEKTAEKMQRSAAKVVAEEEESLRAEAATRKQAAEANEGGLDIAKKKFLEIRGIGEKTVEQMAAGGYFTVEQVHEEQNVVKLGEVTGIGIKKARQIKQAVTQFFEEQARASLLPEGGTGPAEAAAEGSPVPAGEAKTDTPEEG
jgi:N utilization substance protein A